MNPHATSSGYNEVKMMKSWPFVGFFAAVVLFSLTLPAQNTSQNLPSAPAPVLQGSQPKSPSTPSSAAASPTNAGSAPASAQTQSVPLSAQSQTPATKTPTSSADPIGAANAQDDDSVVTLRKTVNEVHLVFTVTDKHGHYIKDLKQNDFKILDDGKPPESIRSFRSETDLPLEVGLLIDASNSIRERFKFEQEAAIEFLNQTIRRNYDQAFVIGFDVTPEVTQDFTDDTEKLANGVRVLRPGGGTALYDAVYYACRDKLMKHAVNGPTRRAIILVSDGDDNQSHVTREEAIEMAQRAEVSIYTISTNLTESGGHGDKTLERIAEATGGRSYVPFQITEVANSFAAIQEELRSQYAVAYKPAAFQTDGRFRSIDIQATLRGLHVRSRRGYYAPTQ
jgi:Ca-activated chloride channel homolog